MARVAVGNRRLMDLEGVYLSGLGPRRDEMAARGRTAIVAAVDGHAVAVLGLAEAPRDTAAATIRALHELDVRVVVLTGRTRTY
jgi:P-type Cu2+ transporter